MDDGNSKEKGYALIYSLATIILATLIIGLVFFIASNVRSQIKSVDSFTRIRDVQEYALQKATKRVKDSIEHDLHPGEGHYHWGGTISGIEMLVQKWVTNGFISETNIGSYDQFDYEVTVIKAETEEVYPYIMNDNTGEYGWLKASSFLPNITNVAVTFYLEATVMYKESDPPRIQTATAEYVYEIQWHEFNQNRVVTQMDLWRNIFYSYDLPTERDGLSANGWVRKILEIYDYPQTRDEFDFANYDASQPAIYGFSGNFLQDFHDGKFLDFLARPITNSLRFKGSFIFNNGLQIDGRQRGNLIVRNLLALRNEGNSQLNEGLNLIKNIDLSANVGMIVDLGNQRDSRLILSQTQLSTGNLWLNNSNSNDNFYDQEGFLLASGRIQIGISPDAIYFPFEDYIQAPTRSNPADASWAHFIAGALVLTNSNIYAGPVTEGTFVQETMDANRTIGVNGNFILSSAAVSSNSKDTDFSYFMGNSNLNEPNEPAKITLEGSNTSMNVRGLSFIDAPKTAHRPSLMEVSEETSFDKFYNNSDYWNRITLKDGSIMELGFTGVEPFVLEVDPTSTFEMKLLPNLSFFDPTFLENGFNNQLIEGRIVLHPFNEKDQSVLQNQLESLGIEYMICRHPNEAMPGKVGILEAYSIPEGSSLFISRTFDYMNTINY